jgi:flagellar hook-basal body complex protein FliE
MTRESQLIVPIRERNRFNLSENIPSTGAIHFDEKQQRVIINVGGTAFPIHVFDHVQVQVKVSESKAHLPRVMLELVTLKTTKPSASSGASSGNAKKIYLENYLETTQKEMENARETHEKMIKRQQRMLEDIVGYKSDSIYGMIRGFDKSEQDQVVYSQEPPLIPIPCIPLFTQTQLQKKKQSIEKRLKEIQSIKQRGGPTNEQEQVKMKDERKYLKAFDTIEKLL